VNENNKVNPGMSCSGIFFEIIKETTLQGEQR